MKLHFGTLFLLIVNSCIAQFLSINEQKKDLKQFQEELYAVHPALFRFADKTAFDSLFKSIENELSDSATVYEFSERIAPVFVLIKDVRTSQRVLKAKPNKLQIPLDVKIIANQLYVKNNICSSPQIKRGYLIESINDESSEVILSKLKKQVSTDANIQTTKIKLIEERFRRYYSANGSKEVSIKFNTGSESLSTTIELMDPEKIKSMSILQGYHKESIHTAPYYHCDIQDGVGYLTISFFALIKWDVFTSFLDEFIAKLNEENIKDLIIDLRWNIGGSRGYPIYLYSKLTDKPFHYVKHLITRQATIDVKMPQDSTKNYQHLKDDIYKVTDGFEGAGLHAPHASNYKGNIYLLVNGLTSQVASLMKSNNRGVIIGEETGGLYAGQMGEGYSNFKLQFSKILIQIPRYRVVLATDPSKNPANRGTLPDVEIKETIDSFLNGEDLYIKKALELITK